MRSLVLMTCAVLIGGAAAGAAFAGVPIDWDPVYTWEPGATATFSPAGGILSGVGVVSSFDVPFADLNAGDPTTEYTIYLTGLVSQGTVTTGSSPFFFYTTQYMGGTIAIYQGSPRNATFDPNPPNANVPSTFTDGTPILTGNFTAFATYTNNFTSFDTGNMEGDIQWTGGTLYQRTFNANGEPCPGLFTGGITWYPPLMIPGYIFRQDGKIDLNCPTAAKSGTWGELKSTYR